jgi:hypothetical protein
MSALLFPSWNPPSRYVLLLLLIYFGVFTGPNRLWVRFLLIFSCEAAKQLFFV